MAKSPHKSAFPDKIAITEFVKSLRDSPRDLHEALIGAGFRVSSETVKNWYYKAPGEIEATKLIGVVLALRAEGRFRTWLRKYSAAPDAMMGEQLPATSSPSPSGARRAVRGEEE